MGVFENLYINARSKLYGIGKTASKYLDISKLKIKVAECEKDIEVKYQKIGEIIYNKVECDEDLDKLDVIDIVSDINNLKEEIREYSEKINSLKGKCICKFCNSLNNAGAQFCSSCGNSLNYTEPTGTSSEGVIESNDLYSSSNSDMNNQNIDSNDNSSEE